MRDGGKRVKLAELEAVDRFMGSLDMLDESKLMVLTAAWRAISERSHEAAWAHVRTVAAREDLERDVEEVRDRALGWAYRGSNVPAMPYSLHSEDEWLRLRREAAPAIVDAALAVALGERLDQATCDLLLGPWLSADGN